MRPKIQSPHRSGKKSEGKERSEDHHDRNVPDTCLAANFVHSRISAGFRSSTYSSETCFGIAHLTCCAVGTNLLLRGIDYSVRQIHRMARTVAPGT